MTIVFPSNGKWWASRGKRGVQADRRVEVFLFTDPRGLGDADHRITLVGTPESLYQVAKAIEAQVASAEVNDPEVA